MVTYVIDDGTGAMRCHQWLVDTKKQPVNVHNNNNSSSSIGGTHTHAAAASTGVGETSAGAAVGAVTAGGLTSDEEHMWVRIEQSRQQIQQQQQQQQQHRQQSQQPRHQSVQPQQRPLQLQLAALTQLLDGNMAEHLPIPVCFNHDMNARTDLTSKNVTSTVNTQQHVQQQHQFPLPPPSGPPAGLTSPPFIPSTIFSNANNEAADASLRTAPALPLSFSVPLLLPVGAVCRLRAVPHVFRGVVELTVTHARPLLDPVSAAEAEAEHVQAVAAAMEEYVKPSPASVRAAQIAAAQRVGKSTTKPSARCDNAGDGATANASANSDAVPSSGASAETDDVASDGATDNTAHASAHVAAAATATATATAVAESDCDPERRRRRHMRALTRAVADWIEQQFKLALTSHWRALSTKVSEAARVAAAMQSKATKNKSNVTAATYDDNRRVNSSSDSGNAGDCSTTDSDDDTCVGEVTTHTGANSATNADDARVNDLIEVDNLSVADSEYTGGSLATTITHASTSSSSSAKSASTTNSRSSAVSGASSRSTTKKAQIKSKIGPAKARIPPALLSACVKLALAATPLCITMDSLCAAPDVLAAARAYVSATEKAPTVASATAGQGAPMSEAAGSGSSATSGAVTASASATATARAAGLTVAEYNKCRSALQSAQAELQSIGVLTKAPPLWVPVTARLGLASRVAALGALETRDAGANKATGSNKIGKGNIKNTNNNSSSSKNVTTRAHTSTSPAAPIPVGGGTKRPLQKDALSHSRESDTKKASRDAADDDRDDYVGRDSLADTRALNSNSTDSDACGDNSDGSNASGLENAGAGILSQQRARRPRAASAFPAAADHGDIRGNGNTDGVDRPATDSATVLASDAQDSSTLRGDDEVNIKDDNDYDNDHDGNHANAEVPSGLYARARANASVRLPRKRIVKKLRGNPYLLAQPAAAAAAVAEALGSAETSDSTAPARETAGGLAGEAAAGGTAHSRAAGALAPPSMLLCASPSSLFSPGIVQIAAPSVATASLAAATAGDSDGNTAVSVTASTATAVRRGESKTKSKRDSLGVAANAADPLVNANASGSGVASLTSAAAYTIQAPPDSLWLCTAGGHLAPVLLDVLRARRGDWAVALSVDKARRRKMLQTELEQQQQQRQLQRQLISVVADLRPCALGQDALLSKKLRSVGSDLRLCALGQGALLAEARDRGGGSVAGAQQGRLVEALRLLAAAGVAVNVRATANASVAVSSDKAVMASASVGAVSEAEAAWSWAGKRASAAVASVLGPGL